MPRILLAGVMLFALVISGCKITGNSANSTQANLRLAHLEANTGAVNLTTTASGNTPVTQCPCNIQGLSFQGISPYTNFTSGNATIFTLVLADGTATLASNTYTLAGNTNYTLVLYGSSGTPETLLLADVAVTNPASGTFEIRPVHTAIASGPLDFYVLPVVTTGVTPSIINSAPSFTSVSLAGVPLFLQFNAGAYVMFAAPAGTKTIVYQSAPIQFNNGDIATADFYTTGSGTLLNVDLMYQNNTNGGTTTDTTVTPEPNLYSQFKIVNASPTVGTINVLANGAGAFSNVPFTGTSSYVLTPAVNTDIEIRATTAPTADVTSAVESFTGGNDYSVVVTGNAANLSLVPLLDNNLPPSVGNAKIRFVNASPNAGSIDVQVNFAAVPSASGLATNAASPYVNFLQNPLPGYTITANVTGSTTPALTLSGVEVLSGGTYTVYIMGNAGALQGVITRDN